MIQTDNNNCLSDSPKNVTLTLGPECQNLDVEAKHRFLAMDSECGESASHFVKEELDIEDVDFSEEPSDREEDLNLPEATDLRCGEVYLGCNGSFTFVCSICANCFPNSELFQAHVQDAHFQLNTKMVYDDAGDAVAECNDQDTLSNSPSVGGPFTEQVNSTRFSMVHLIVNKICRYY